MTQLAEAGYDVWAGDLRGHGQSVSAKTPLAHLDPGRGWDGMIDDMAAFARRAFRDAPPDDCVMVGGALSCHLMLSLLHRQPHCAGHLVMAPPTPRQVGVARLAASFLKLRRLTQPIDRPDPQIMHHVYAFLKAGLPPGASDAEVMSAFPDVVAAVLSDPRGFPTPTLGYWLTVLPGLQRCWDEIAPGQLDPGLRVLVVSSDDDPQLRGARPAAQLIDWFTRRGVTEASYADLPGARAYPMIDSGYLPFARLVGDWLDRSKTSNAAPTALPPAPVESPVTRLVAEEAPHDLHDLIRLCYEALEDDSRWVELIYRLSMVGEQDGWRVESLLEAIQPHWQRAYELREELRRAAMLGVIYTEVIDRLDLGVGMLDGTGALRHANAAFRAALARWIEPAAGDSLTTGDRLVRLVSAQPQWPPPQDRDCPVLLDERLVGVSFVPQSLRRAASDARGPLPRLIVLRGHDGRAGSQDHRAGLLTLSFGLTGQEALVALMLTDGLATNEAADRLGVSEHTVRSHLKQVFTKMGVSSRTEMASQIMASPLGWLTGEHATAAFVLGERPEPK